MQKYLNTRTGQGSATTGAGCDVPVVAIHQHHKQLATTQVNGHSLANVDVHNSTSVDVHAARKAAVRTPAQKLEQARQRVRAALRLASAFAPRSGSPPTKLRATRRARRHCARPDPRDARSGRGGDGRRGASEKGGAR